MISALGGSRVQIGGPTGAFVVIVARIVARHGVDGLILETLLAGLLLVAMGLLRLGALIKVIPFPVTTGFTAGIALIVFSQQVRDRLGLPLDPVPSEFFGKWIAYLGHLGEVSWPTAGLSLATLGILVLWPRVSARVPAFVALIAAGDRVDAPSPARSKDSAHAVPLTSMARAPAGGAPSG